MSDTTLAHTNDTSGAASRENASRQAWETPSLTKLPSLTELTLVTGGRIPGRGGSGGTVF